MVGSRWYVEGLDGQREAVVVMVSPDQTLGPRFVKPLPSMIFGLDSHKIKVTANKEYRAILAGHTIGSYIYTCRKSAWAASFRPSSHRYSIHQDIAGGRIHVLTNGSSCRVHTSRRSRCWPDAFPIRHLTDQGSRSNPPRLACVGTGIGIVVCAI